MWLYSNKSDDCNYFLPFIHELVTVAAKFNFIINRESRIIFLRIVRISSLVAFPSKKAEYMFALQIILSILESIKFSLKMVNLFQVFLAICHKLIQQILYTQWNRIISHFYRLTHTVSHKSIGVNTSINLLSFPLYLTIFYFIIS